MKDLNARADALTATIFVATSGYHVYLGDWPAAFLMFLGALGYVRLAFWGKGP